MQKKRITPRALSVYAKGVKNYVKNPGVTKEQAKKMTDHLKHEVRSRPWAEPGLARLRAETAKDFAKDAQGTKHYINKEFAGVQRKIKRMKAKTK